MSEVSFLLDLTPKVSPDKPVAVGLNSQNVQQRREASTPAAKGAGAFRDGRGTVVLP
jgi:hypothetical protein